MAMREGLKICMRQGIKPRKVAQAKYYYLPFLLLIPATKWLYNQRMLEGHVRHSPAEMRDMYVNLLSVGREYGIKMYVYESYRKYVLDYFSNLDRRNT